MKLNFSVFRTMAMSVLLLLGMAAQARVISGTVKDQTGETIISASVVVKGTSIGTVTDFDGNYSLDVPDDAKVLVFSYIGMKTQELNITGSVMNVVLSENSEVLEEVVVTGYGTTKKRDVVTSVASVNADQLKDIPVASASEALQGKLAGVSVTTTEGSPDADVKIPYDEAKKTVKEALAVMGEEYSAALEHGMESGWIDVYENKGKRGGAYSWGSYGVHPFVLLNHNDTINSMFTLAHEMGHALHSFFTWKKQPYLYADHKIFVAEVASTCNEALLMEHLLQTTDDKVMRKYLINYFLEQFRGTLFRQTMFAEFEKITHSMAEKGEPLTWEGLNKIYHDLNVKYFGEEIVIDPEIDIEWARIPHFYNAFYVYQYATGYSAAIALSRKILKEGQPAVDAYLDFLSKGDSEYSIDLLKGAGVDMSAAEPIENAMQLFKELLDEFETL